MNEKLKINYASLKQIVDFANENNLTFSEVVIMEQVKNLGISEENLLEKMNANYQVMKDSISNGLENSNKLKIEQIGGAKIYNDYVASGKSLFGDKIGKVMSRAMAVAEVNASMGKICATPTAGSCGILPGSIVTIQEIYNIPDEKIIKSLFAAAGIGLVFSNIVGVAGAAAGCQAECGIASAMSAGMIVELLGGTNEMILDAVAIALKNIEGLVCDPVASLVECPCIKRNAHEAMSAILAADLVLAGIKSIIPADEVIKSLKEVGTLMNPQFKETSLGGLASTDTGQVLMKNIFGGNV